MISIQLCSFIEPPFWGGRGKKLQTVQRSVIFILNVLLESNIHFTYPSIIIAKNNVGIFT